MDIRRRRRQFIHLLLILAGASSISLTTSQQQQQQQLITDSRRFGSPFTPADYSTLAVVDPATISNGALQVTPDSAGNFTLSNRSGRILYNNTYKLWDDGGAAAGGHRTASFNTSFLINIFRLTNSSLPGEGLAFLIAPNLELPAGSSGQYLGLTNRQSDGNSSNQILAVELDTFKQDFDPDANHLGLDVHSVRSVKTASLRDHGIQLAPAVTRFYVVWIQYDGRRKRIKVYMAENGTAMPETPILEEDDLDLRGIVNQHSYFGFAASTGNNTQLNCVLSWNLSVELLDPEELDTGADSGGSGVKIGVGIGVSVLILVGVMAAAGWWWWGRKKAAEANPKLTGALKSLPGMPREFEFKDLKKATNNFDERLKLGQGGFGMVYKGVLPEENIPIAVKKFSRENLKGQDDFLSELTIINRLRHKHLVRLLGWCHKNGILLIVYDYMPNGSLDKHLFNNGEDDKNVPTTLQWKLRYKIVTGVASALHYLHNEYDQKVVHRDLKASNIMLDAEFSARLGDFGLARAIDNEKTSYAELEGVPGTMGYIAPECFHTGKATCESDVYGFGAVVLEVVCGQRPWTRIGGFTALVDWVWWLHREGRILEAVDKRLGNEFVEEEAKRLLLLGLACSHPIAGQRPNMQLIYQIVSGSMEVPRVPPFKPAFVWAPVADPEGEDGSTSSSMRVDLTPDTTPITSGWSAVSDGYNSGTGNTESYSPV
ncbi:Probable L-type lectin-domain containing receptor kinase S.5 [Linum grandiflorum]